MVGIDDGPVPIGDEEGIWRRFKQAAIEVWISRNFLGLGLHMDAPYGEGVLLGPLCD